MSSSDSFSQWMEQRKAESNRSSSDSSSDWSFELTEWQNSLMGQFQSYSSLLPDSGSLSAEYRNRLMNSMYLLLVAALFAFLAIFVGLPTIALRPSKFVLCSTLCSIFVAASAIVFKRPSIFLKELWESCWDSSGGPSSTRTSSFPLMGLLVSNLLTVYITVVYHRYLYTMIAAGIQLLCIAWYLLSYLPFGGTANLTFLLKSLWYVVLKPLFYTVWTAAATCASHCCSSS